MMKIKEYKVSKLWVIEDDKRMCEKNKDFVKILLNFLEMFFKLIKKF